MLDGAARARIDSTGLQVIDVEVDGGYRPALIRARAGLPLRLVFRRSDDAECSERVVFSTPRLERHLAPAATTIVDLPAQPVGAVRFTCGMGRYTGRIELAEEPTSPLARLRQQFNLLETPLGTALVLWICSLPLIALLALLMLDASAAIVVAGAALVGWVLGCLWAFGRGRQTGQGIGAAGHKRHEPPAAR